MLHYYIYSLSSITLVKTQNKTNNTTNNKLYDKRNSFPFSIVRMPHADSNIPQNIFYSAIKGEFLRIARSTLLINDLVPKAKELLKRMESQGSRSVPTKRSLRKIILTHQEDFQHFHIPYERLIDLLTNADV